MAQDFSLFGANPDEVGQQLNQQRMAEAMQIAMQAGPQGNPYYIPSVGAGLRAGAGGLAQAGANLFGMVPPEIQKAYTMQEVMKETDSSGIEFDKDPVGYAKVAASNMLKRGLRTEALKAMQWAIDNGVQLAQTKKLEAGEAGPQASGHERATARVVDWISRKKNGIPTTEKEDYAVMADVELIESLKFTDEGKQVSDKNSLREIVTALKNQPTAFANSQATPSSTYPAEPVVVNPSASLGPSKGTYSSEPYVEGNLVRRPDPQRQGRKLQEDTQAVLNDMRTKPILVAAAAFNQVEDVLSKYMGKDVPGIGPWESMVTMGDPGMVKNLGRMGYQLGQEYGTEGSKQRSKEANEVLQAIDAFMKIDVAQWAGASVTEGEAARQQLALALEKGVVDENVIKAFEKYKSVLRAQMASYLGGVDPDIKRNLTRDPAFGNVFSKALNDLPFGSRPYGKLKSTGETIWLAPDGKKYFEEYTD